MKARQIQVDATKLIGTLEQLRNRSGFQDPNFMEIKIPDKGKRAKFPVRAIGEMATCRSHYVGNIIPNLRELEIGIYVNCIGRYEGCPLCDINNALSEIKSEKAENAAKDFWSTERNFINVLPKGDYDFGDLGERFLILPFGATARKTLEPIVDDYGHPGDIEYGFDMDYIITKKAKGIGSDYLFKVVTEKKREKGRISTDVVLTPLDEKELDYELVDLDSYCQEPDSDTLEMLSDMFSVDDILSSSKNKNRRQSVTGATKRGKLPKAVEEEDEDFEDEDGVPFCFGDFEAHNPKDEVCLECEFFRDCKRDIKLQRIEGIKNVSPKVIEDTRSKSLLNALGETVSYEYL